MFLRFLILKPGNVLKLFVPFKTQILRVTSICSLSREKNQYTIQTPFAGEGVDRGKP
jgi:hypothetical protein